MGQIKTSREAQGEVEKALGPYEKVRTQCAHVGALTAKTQRASFNRSRDFVLWLRGDIDPGARNRTSTAF